MSILNRRHKKALQKKAKRGKRGYPIATVAFYGPDDQRASKVAVGIVPIEEGADGTLRRWFSETGDVRLDESILKEVLEFIQSQGARSIAMMDKIFGCPHEEGIDYPDGEVCPQCPFWAHRDRFTGKIIH